MSTLRRSIACLNPSSAEIWAVVWPIGFAGEAGRLVDRAEESLPICVRLVDMSFTRSCASWMLLA